MLPRERVIATIEHRPTDRMPIYGWVRANLEEAISAQFGSVEAFEDHYAFDFAHLFGGPPAWDGERLEEARKALGCAITPRELLEIPMTDPDRTEAYDDIREQVAYHKGERARFCYVQTPGIFEALNGPFGIENHLSYLALYPEDLAAVYARQCAWNQRFAHNCLDLGVDMIHISDDWGSQRGPLFSPRTWWRLIYPHHKPTCQAVKARGAYLSLHSDGNILPLLDGVVDLGFDVVHPWQESAGMTFDAYQGHYDEAFVLMGGLDVQTMIGFGRLEALRADIERVMRRFAGGGLLYCTSHFVQDHCTMDELTFAFDHVYRTARALAAGTEPPEPGASPAMRGS